MKHLSTPLSGACLALMAMAAFPAKAVPSLINDTAQATCYAPTGNNPAVASCLNSGQDGAYGRDFTAPNPNNGDYGFYLVKVCNSGEKANTFNCPAAPPLGSQPNEWACTLDMVSGLLWEVKTTDATNRDMSALFGYTDYPGAGLTGADTFAASVNAAPGGLCGSTNWRVPTYLELGTLQDYFRVMPAPRIDPVFFPNTPVDAYGTWTTTPYTFDGTYHRTMSFGGGGEGGFAGFFPQHARLVSGTPLANVVRFTPIPSGTGLKDPVTGLVWRRCVEGTYWNGTECVGTPMLTNWAGALQRAAAVGGTWRLPNAAELATLLVPSWHSGCILLPEPFPSSGPIWSNTPLNVGNDAAVFDNGYSSCAPRRSWPVGSQGEIRLVRPY